MRQQWWQCSVSDRLGFPEQRAGSRLQRQQPQESVQPARGRSNQEHEPQPEGEWRQHHRQYVWIRQACDPMRHPVDAMRHPCSFEKGEGITQELGKQKQLSTYHSGYSLLYLCRYHVLVLKFTVSDSDIDIATQAFLWLVFSWYILFNHFTFNLCLLKLLSI